MTQSRFPGFHRLPLAERRATLARALGLTEDALDGVLESGGLEPALADKVVENALGVYSLPFGVALNFRINGVDRLAPMVVEEPSVIAAASNAAKMVRAGGGFQARVEDPLMVAQIELRHVPGEDRATARILTEKPALLERAAAALPGLVRRGGGPRDLSVRRLGEGHLVVHLAVDCRDAMGANLLNGAAEALGPELARLVGAELGLCILSNLSDQRVARVNARVPFDALVGSLTGTTGRSVAQGIAAASRFAELDPYRATTHNKGVMNGVDSIVIATGNDYRAVEAGAHAFAVQGGHYGPLATWRVDGEELVGELALPLALGIVGGTLRVHRAARLALQLSGVGSASELAELAGAVGLASNLAALRALSSEGIQRGHMALHARSVAVAAGAMGDEVEAVARLLTRDASIDKQSAEARLAELRAATKASETP